MLKTLPQLVWAFDCEWIPDLVIGRRVYKLGDELSDAEVVAHMWKEGGATPENPEPFLKIILSRVVSVAMMARTQLPSGDVELQLHALPNDGTELEEKALIERFLNGIGKKQPQLVGFNSFDSDLPILIQRGLACGVSAPEFAKRPEKPWEGYDYFSKTSEAHLDIRAMVSGWGKGASPSLHQLAVACGIPGKLDVSGNEVFRLWQEGKIKEIVDYNECDAVTTYLVWLRMAYFSGFFTEKQYEKEQNLVLDYLKDMVLNDGKEHFNVFMDHWDFAGIVRKE